MTEIYVDADACPVREEVYRVATRLGLTVFVVSNGSRPLRPPGLPNVQMILVGDRADAADDWIAERITERDVCVTSDIPLAARCLAKGARVVPPSGRPLTQANIATHWPAASWPGICASSGSAAADRRRWPDRIARGFSARSIPPCRRPCAYRTRHRRVFPRGPMIGAVRPHKRAEGGATP